MTEFADLSTFKYTSSPWVFSSGFPYILLNIGWLGNSIPKADSTMESTVQKSVLYNLSEFMKFPVNLYRGYHTCEIRGFDPMANGGDLKQGGNGEIFVPGINNLVYVAPTMIYHYVSMHGYVPPGEFIDAVRNIGDMQAYSKFHSLYKNDEQI